ELGIAEEIDEAYREPQALAESELAAWLAAPDQFGFPPAEMELVDARTQYWPGFDEPQPCWLFRFTYQLPGGGTFSNIGLAGPVAMAFQADLGNLPVDDIYAAMAGWHAEHPEIFEVPVHGMNADQRAELERLVRVAEREGFASIQPIALAFFFQTVTLVARAEQEGRSLCIVADGDGVLALPSGSGPEAMTPEVATCIYRGRRLLRAFNA
ncbi:MAG: HEAT repeat domain-containing protein, partial [Planctomycetota bacterium]